MNADANNHLTKFDELYLRSRFGHEISVVELKALAQELLSSPDREKHERARVAVRTGIVLADFDQDASTAYINMARSLGADIPHVVARPDETGAPLSPVFGLTERPRLNWIEIPGGIPNPDLRPANGDAWHPSFGLVAADAPPLRATVIEEGFLSVDTTRGRVQTYFYDAGQRLIPEVSSGPEPFMESAIRVNGPAALLDDVFSSFNVCHALYDKFPRLGAYARVLPGAALTAVFFQDHPYYRQAMERFGHEMFTPPASGRWTVQAAKLALLSNHRRGEVLHPGYRGAESTRSFLARHTQASRQGSRRVFISRRDASIERVVNARVVETCFERHGFDIIAVGSRSLSQQAELFGQCSHIAGVHGAGMANLAFAAPGTEVFEIMHPIACSSANWVMAQMLGQTYSMFLADDAEYVLKDGARYDATLTNRPVIVDVERLSEMLKSLYG